MATHDEIHKDLYDKINTCTSEMKELTGAVRILTQQNEKFFNIIEKQNERQQKVIKWAFIIVAVCLLIIGYGAIGDKGMAAVRDTLPSIRANQRPTIDNNSTQPADQRPPPDPTPDAPRTTYAIPATDDGLDKWRKS